MWKDIKSKVINKVCVQLNLTVLLFVCVALEYLCIEEDFPNWMLISFQSYPHYISLVKFSCNLNSFVSLWCFREESRNTNSSSSTSRSADTKKVPPIWDNGNSKWSFLSSTFISFTFPIPLKQLIVSHRVKAYSPNVYYIFLLIN